MAWLDGFGSLAESCKGMALNIGDTRDEFSLEVGRLLAIAGRERDKRPFEEVAEAEAMLAIVAEREPTRRENEMRAAARGAMAAGLALTLVGLNSVMTLMTADVIEDAIRIGARWRAHSWEDSAGAGLWTGAVSGVLLVVAGYGFSRRFGIARWAIIFTLSLMLAALTALSARFVYVTVRNDEVLDAYTMVLCGAVCGITAWCGLYILSKMRLFLSRGAAQWCSREIGQYDRQRSPEEFSGVELVNIVGAERRRYEGGVVRAAESVLRPRAEEGFVRLLKRYRREVVQLVLAALGMAAFSAANTLDVAQRIVDLNRCSWAARFVAWCLWRLAAGLFLAVALIFAANGYRFLRRRDAGRRGLLGAIVAGGTALALMALGSALLSANTCFYLSESMAVGAFVFLASLPVYALVTYLLWRHFTSPAAVLWCSGPAPPTRG